MRDVYCHEIDFTGQNSATQNLISGLDREFNYLKFLFEAFWPKLIRNVCARIN